MIEEQIEALLKLGIDDSYIEHIEWIDEAYHNISTADDEQYLRYEKRCKKLSRTPLPRRSEILDWLQVTPSTFTQDELIAIQSIITMKNKSNLKYTEPTDDDIQRYDAISNLSN